GVGEPLIANPYEIALLGDEATPLEQRPRRVARLDGQALRAARLGELGQRLNERGPRAPAGEFGMDKEHVDRVRALEAGEAGDRAVDHCEQGQLARESSAEGLFVVRL